VVAENLLLREQSRIETTQIAYSGFAGPAVVLPPNAKNIERRVPLILIGARNAVESALRARAVEYADAELQKAQSKLAVLEEAWATFRGHDHDRYERDFTVLAHDAMRFGEEARAVAVERAQQARVQSERETALIAIAQARSDAANAHEAAEHARAELTRAQQDAEAARRRAEQAQTDADRSKANEDIARAEAEEARLQAEQARVSEDLARTEAEETRARLEEAKRDQQAMRDALDAAVAEVLEARRETRGLIVDISDVLFDVNQASLTPGALDKVRKLAGILMEYSGGYRIDIEGHTDSTGSGDFNQRLSEERAQSVRAALVAAGIPAERIAEPRGAGKERPVATNGTTVGRQFNRRVEIVIADIK